MTKRIFRKIVLTALTAVLLATAMLVASLYGLYENIAASSLRTEADYILRALEQAEDDQSFLESLDADTRVTIVASGGEVLYDSIADEETLENHARRPEVLQALEQGTGESRRVSNTLSGMTFYHALRMKDGNVLRVSTTRRSLLGVLTGILPQLLLVLAGVTGAALLIARICARQIVAPVNSLDLDVLTDGEVYEELTPLLARLDRQRLQIRYQMRELARAHSELAAIMENMREGLVLLDGQNAVLSMNGSAAAVFGVGEENRTGLNLSEICHDEEILALAQQAQSGQSSDMIFRRGSRVYRVLGSPVRQQDRVRGAALLILDVTERYAAEESRREFTANVSHELKTPLTSISGYAEIIRDGIALPEDMPAFAGKIHSEARRLLALVNDIMELSRLDEKQGLGEKENVALRPLLLRTVENFQPMARQKGVDLLLRAEETLVEGYPFLLGELFGNLIENAIKYTPGGGSVCVTMAHEDDRVVVSVADTGIGIPPEHHAHVFERFYRVDKSHSRQTGGTGLGLAIVKHAAQVHEAQVELQSEVGRGTTMTVRF